MAGVLVGPGQMVLAVIWKRATSRAIRPWRRRSCRPCSRNKRLRLSEPRAGIGSDEDHDGRAALGHALSDHVVMLIRPTG